MEFPQTIRREQQESALLFSAFCPNTYGVQIKQLSEAD
jgi:hypothetical protein